MLAIRHLILTCLMMAIGACASRPDGPTVFSFALLGDQQYNVREELLFGQLIDAINAEPLAFVVHVGDFKAGSHAPCTDALFLQRKDEFNRSLHAFIYTPGDNEWVDCRRATNGGADPLERLAKLREVFFGEPNSLGQTAIMLTRQSEMAQGNPVTARYRENAMWIHGGIVFATLNIQGSNDNLGFNSASDHEHAERTRANIAWLDTAMTRARDAEIAGLAIFLQANPGFEDKPSDMRNGGFRQFLEAFEQRARALNKPILFAHGDTHHFRIGRPYLSPLDKRPLPNVTRVETYGSPFVNWVRITVDRTARDHLFYIESGGFAPASGN